MKTSLLHLVRGVIQLGSGEMLARLCSIAIVILLGHRYGVAIVGIYALAMTVSYYMQPVIDFGLRHIGARLMAQYPQSASEIMHRVQRRRLAMAGAVLPLTLIYALLAKLQLDMKVWLFLFSATGALHALSLEWAAWGREQLQMIGLMRVVVPLSILVAIAVAPPGGTQVLWWACAGNAIGFVLQAVIFRYWWKGHHFAGSSVSAEQRGIADALALRRSTMMGLSVVAGLTFNSIDTLMLGVMSNPQQVGLYSAAYRVLNQVLVTYYLLTNVLYPQFARQTIENRVRALRPGILLLLLGGGVAVAGVIAALRQPLLTMLFGHQFLPARLLLLLLAWAIPFDFLTTYLSAAYAAWGMEKKILLCSGIAAGSNIVLNLIWIPQYGAHAAAVNTLISYVIFLACLALAGQSVRTFSNEATPRPELVA